MWAEAKTLTSEEAIESAQAFQKIGEEQSLTGKVYIYSSEVAIASYSYGDVEYGWKP